MTAGEVVTGQLDAAALQRVYATLPPAGSPEYWRRIETPHPEEAVPLEVLVRCVRERYDAGKQHDAHRLFTVIVGRTQRQVMAWSARVAAQGAGAQRQLVRAELVQECYLELWRILTTGEIAFWAELFGAAMVSLQSHTAHACMMRWGFWTRTGVRRPRRVPARDLRSLNAPLQDDASTSLADSLEDPAAVGAFERVEYAEMLSLVRALDPAKRAVIYGRYWQGMSQQEIAAALSVGTRAVRWREQRALDTLRARLAQEGLAQEGGSHEPS